MNNNEKEYETHIKKSWNFAQETTKSPGIEGRITANATITLSNEEGI